VWASSAVIFARITSALDGSRGPPSTKPVWCLFGQVKPEVLPSKTLFSLITVKRRRVRSSPRRHESTADVSCYTLPSLAVSKIEPAFKHSTNVAYHQWAVEHDGIQFGPP
jgi:hypothetical protein